MRLSMTTVTRRIMLLSLVLGVILVAAPRALAVPPDIGESGISGTVLQRTLCASGTCVEPTRGLVTAVSMDSPGITSTAKADAQGIFVLKLAPGLYKVSAASLGFFSHKSEPALIRVYPGFMIAIRIVLPTH